MNIISLIILLWIGKWDRKVHNQVKCKLWRIWLRDFLPLPFTSHNTFSKLEAMYNIFSSPYSIILVGKQEKISFSSLYRILNVRVWWRRKTLRLCLQRGTFDVRRRTKLRKFPFQKLCFGSKFGMALFNTRLQIFE